MSSAPVTDSLPEEQKRSGRRPEGPAHARKGSTIQTLKRTMTEFSEDNLTDAAAALTYYAVLSIFPALLAMISIVGLVGDPQTDHQDVDRRRQLDRPGLRGRHVQGPDRGPDQEQRDRRHHGHRRDRRGAVDRVGLRRRVHARGQRHLRGRGGPLVHQAAPAADARDARARRAAGARPGGRRADRPDRERRRLGRRPRRHRGDRLEHRQVAGPVRRGGLHDHPPVLRLAEREARRPEVDHARQPRWRSSSGWSPRRPSRSTSPTSARTTRPTARSAA